MSSANSGAAANQLQLKRQKPAFLLAKSPIRAGSGLSLGSSGQRHGMARPGMGNGGMGKRSMMRATAFLDHAAHIRNTFAALRPVSEMAVDRRHRAAALINCPTHIALGQTMAQADIHLRRHQNRG